MRIRLPMLTVIPRGGVHQGAFTDLAFSPDGKVLASGGMDRTVWFWEVATGKPSGRIRENDREITALAFAPDGSLLAGGTSLGVSLWRVGTSQAGVKPVPTAWDKDTVWHSCQVAARCSPLSSHIWRVRVPHWDLVPKFENPPFTSQNTIALSPDGKQVAGGGNSEAVTLWDVDSGKVLCQLKGHEENFLRAVAFSPDGRLLASAGPDGTIRLWSVAERREVGRLEGFLKNVNGLVFSPDGRWLASGGDDWRVRLWERPPQGSPPTRRAHGSGDAAFAFLPMASCWPPAARTPRSCSGMCRKRPAGNSTA